MSAEIELKHALRSLIRNIKRDCHCVLSPKPEDEFCIHNCQLCIPKVNELRKEWKRRQKRYGFGTST